MLRLVWSIASPACFLALCLGCAGADLGGSGGQFAGGTQQKESSERGGKDSPHDEDLASAGRGKDASGGADAEDGEDLGRGDADVDEGSGGGDSGDGGDLGDLGLSVDDAGELGEDELEALCRKAKVRTKTIKIEFARNLGQGCPIGINGNVPRLKNNDALKHTTSARGIQSHELEVPGVACEIKIRAGGAQGANSQWYYDDIAMFTMDGYMLAYKGYSPDFFADSWGMQRSGKLVRFDFEKMIYKPAAGVPTGDHCPYKGSCKIPVTQTFGELELEIPAGWFGNLPKRERAKKKHLFELQILGNQNDPNDCTHSGLSLEATVKYVQ